MDCQIILKTLFPIESVYITSYTVMPGEKSIHQIGAFKWNKFMCLCAHAHTKC